VTEPQATNFGKPELVPVEYMYVDRRYQRDRNEKLINRIINGLDPDYFGALLLSKRNETHFAILDGQQRHAGLVGLKYDRDHQKVPAVVLRNLSPEREGEIFEVFNFDRKQVTPYDRWKSRMFRGEAIAMQISQVCDSVGLRVGMIANEKSSNVIRCIGTLEAMWEHTGNDTLARILRTIHMAWPDEVIDRDMLHGMTMFVLQYHDVLDDNALLKRIALRTQTGVLHSARVMKDSKGDAVAVYVAFNLIDIYNKGRTAEKRLAVIPPGSFGAVLRDWNGGVKRTYQPRKASKQGWIARQHQGRLDYLQSNLVKARAALAAKRAAEKAMSEPKTAAEIVKQQPNGEGPRYKNIATLQDAWRNGRINDREFRRQVRLFMEDGLATPNALVLANRLIKARRGA
jgi:hypothetical protein